MHWLLHILSFGFSYNEEGFSYTLKLFGKRIALGEKLEDEEEEPDADSTDTAVHETKAEVENILPSDSKMQRRDVSVKDVAEAKRQNMKQPMHFPLNPDIFFYASIRPVTNRHN